MKWKPVVPIRRASNRWFGRQGRLWSALGMEAFITAMLPKLEKVTRGKLRRRVQAIRLHCLSIEQTNLGFRFRSTGMPPNRSERVQVIKNESERLIAIFKAAGDDHEAKVAGLQVFLAENPESGRCHSFLGRALWQKGEWDASLDAYEEAIRRAGKDSMSGILDRLHIGQVLSERGNHEAAITALQNLITNIPDDLCNFLGLIYFEFGNVLEKSGDVRHARRAWEESLHYDTTDSLREKAKAKLTEKRL